MKTVSLSGSARPNVGKKDAKALRNQGLVPCVMYGGKDQIHFFAPEKSLEALFYTPEVAFVELEVNGKKVMTLPQDVQFHKVTDRILHVDFLELNENRPIMMAIPVKVTGNSVGVLKGGKLHKAVRKLRIKSLPKDMPETIEIDITPLDILDFVKVSDLPTKNYTFVENPSTKIVTIRTTRNVAANAGAEAPAKK